MSDETELSEVTTAKPAETTPQESPKRSKAPVIVGLLALLLALVAIAAAVYNYWFVYNLQLQQQKVGQTREAMQTLLVANQQALRQQQNTNSALKQQLDALVSQQRSLYDANTELKRRLQQLSYTDRSDWQLAEVEYMLRLAHQRVVSNNAKLGLALLLSADELLRGLDIAELFAIRKQIANDAAALRGAVDVDVEGLYLALGALVNGVQDIQFNQSDLAPAAVEVTPDSNSNSNSNSLARMWQQLARLYRVTPRESPIKPLYSEAQQQALRQQLLLLIGQSRQALLTASSGLYVASLAEAKDIAQQYAISNEALTTFIRQIDVFLATDIVPDLPSISGSHTKMRAYIDSKRRREPVPTETTDIEAP